MGSIEVTHPTLQMFTYAVPDSPDCHEHISGFVSSGYTLVPRQAVPPESAGIADVQVRYTSYLIFISMAEKLYIQL